MNEPTAASFMAAQAPADRAPLATQAPAVIPAWRTADAPAAMNEPTAASFMAAQPAADLTPEATQAADVRTPWATALAAVARNAPMAPRRRAIQAPADRAPEAIHAADARAPWATAWAPMRIQPPTVFQAEATAMTADLAASTRSMTHAAAFWAPATTALPPMIVHWTPRVMRYGVRMVATTMPSTAMAVRWSFIQPVTPVTAVPTPEMAVSSAGNIRSASGATASNTGVRTAVSDVRALVPLVLIQDRPAMNTWKNRVASGSSAMMTLFLNRPQTLANVTVAPSASMMESPAILVVPLSCSMLSWPDLTALTNWTAPLVPKILPATFTAPAESPALMNPWISVVTSLNASLGDCPALAMETRPLPNVWSTELASTPALSRLPTRDTESDRENPNSWRLGAARITDPASSFMPTPVERATRNISSRTPLMSLPWTPNAAMDWEMVRMSRSWPSAAPALLTCLVRVSRLSPVSPVRW